MKKVFGIIFIALASLLSLSAILQIPKFLQTIFSLIKNDEAPTIHKWENLGGFLLTYGIILTLFNYGFKWVQKTKTNKAVDSLVENKEDY